ncbi:hypothetical protein D9758_006554 [Tetrapyrgos nigripes]|uniref:Uncharacterized protein n=1 Tax=Tetrapyrgos nigripes TaxID=182062 RepID=A0A8H5LRF6_9AGAR|nr:hypothetical protein D9758_006554 [Tetrapyrgos nigripes]
MRCLDHITRQACPLCREPFDIRTIVKLHVDVDGCGASAPAYAEARRLQREIAQVANEGTTEPKLRQLISECKTFLHSQDRGLFEDLRVSHRMLAYLCEIKSKSRAQNQEVARLATDNENLQEEVKRLETDKITEIERLEEERAERDRTIVELERIYREERERARDAELESRRKVMEMQERYIQQLEARVLTCGLRYRIANKLRLEMDNLRTELSRMTTTAGIYQESFKPSDAPLISISTPPSGDEELNTVKEERYSTELDFMISPLPEFTTTILPQEYSSLPPIEDLPEGNSTEDGQRSCGAAGCPFSCNCQTFRLFSMTGQTSAPLELPSPGGPSLLSLTAPRGEDSPHSLSSYSPSTPSDHPPIEDPTSTCPPSPPSPPLPSRSPSNLQVERLRDLLTDSSSPNMTSSMPDLGDSHYSRRERSDSQTSVSSKRPLPSRSLESSTASLAPTPLSVPSVQPASGITPEVTTAVSQPIQQRHGVSRASSAAYALENAQRQIKERQKADLERRRAEKLEDWQTGASRGRSPPVSGVPEMPAEASHGSSKSHSYYSGAGIDMTSSGKGYQSYHAAGIDSQRSSYSNPSTLSSKMEGRSLRSKYESSLYSPGVDADRSSYTTPSSLSKAERRLSRSSSKVNQDANPALEGERSSYSNAPSKLESRASHSSSKLPQEASSDNAGIPVDRSSYSNSTPKSESRASRSSPKTPQETLQPSAKQYFPIQWEQTASHNYQSASTSSSYRDYDSALYANTPPTSSHMTRPTSSTASTQVKSTSSSNGKDGSSSYRQYSSSSGKNKLVSPSSLTANAIGYAHA